MKIVVTGKGGQLSSELEYLNKNNPNWKFLSINDLNIAEYNKLKLFFERNKTDLIINCAAYTDVEKAQDEPENAYLANKIGVDNLIKVCERFSIKLIHYSTDYVFDGKNKTQLDESCKTAPINIYGHSKLAGETCIINSRVKSIIIRTSWVYSVYGNNFVKKIIKLAKNNSSISVINDQIGTPTNAADLADATSEIISYNKYNWKIGDIFHFSNDGFCSWYDFAVEILNFYNFKTKVDGVKSQKFKFKADRPKNSILSKKKITTTFNLEIKDWKISLKEVLNRININYI